jgi:hypothetical protein
MKWRSTAARMVLLIVVTLGGSCGSVSPPADNESDVRVLDLKITGFPVAWVDDETILLRVDTGQSWRRRDGSLSAVSRLATYNYKTGAKRMYGRADSGICYAEGYVSYIHEDEVSGELVASYGDLGRETSRPFKPGEVVFDRGERGSCRPWSERPPRPSWIQNGIAVWPLHPYEGFLNCNVPAATLNTRDIRARFHRPADQTGVELPFSCYQVQTSLRYYRFKDAYFGLEFDVRSPWPIGRDRRVFWLRSNGAVEELILSYSDAIRDEIIPTARGLVAFSRPHTGQGDYWVQLLTSDATKRLLRGYARGVTSPDGCKLAILHDPEYRARIEKRPTIAQPSVKVLEVCRPDGEGISHVDGKR